MDAEKIKIDDIEESQEDINDIGDDIGGIMAEDHDELNVQDDADFNNNNEESNENYVTDTDSIHDINDMNNDENDHYY